MKSTDDRKLFGAPIGASAATGNIAVIPQTQTTAGDGTASVALGFPPETFIARAAGGEPPRGQDMNGLLNLLSSATQVLQAGYLGPFDETFAQGIGGYPAGAIVSGATAGTFWVSMADANVSTPGATGATWQSLFNGLATQVALTSEAQQRSNADQILNKAITDEAAARVAAQYVPSVPATDQTRITSLVENSDGRAVFGDGTNSPVLANLDDLPFSDPTQKIQSFTAYVQFSNGTTTIKFPKAFKEGTVPDVFVPSTQEQSNKWTFIGILIQSNGTLAITNTGVSLYGVGWGGGSTFANLIENNFIPVIASGVF
jgi:hypothetical protein